jgi:hypothetical protein
MHSPEKRMVLDSKPAEVTKYFFISNIEMDSDVDIGMDSDVISELFQ